MIQAAPSEYTVMWCSDACQVSLGCICLFQNVSLCRNWKHVSQASSCQNVYSGMLNSLDYTGLPCQSMADTLHTVQQLHLQKA